MPKEQVPGKPQTRWYSQEEKDGAVRLVRTLRAELGISHGTIQRVASQLGYGVESVRSWVRQADVDDGHSPGVSSEDSVRVKAPSRTSGNSSGPMRSCGGRRLSAGRSSTANTSCSGFHRRQS